MTISQSKKKFLCVYSLFFLISAAVIFLFFGITKSSFIANADGFNQYYPAYVYIGQWYRRAGYAILHRSPVPMYDFSIGFGSDILSSLNYYGMGDIFNITSIFFPGKLSALGYSLTVLLRMYCAGLSFSALSFLYSKSGSAVLAGSINYVFSAFALSSGMLFPPFLTMIVYLPLIIKGINELLYDKKISLLLIISIALQTAASFYFLYMNVLFSGLWTVLATVFVFPCKKKETIKRESKFFNVALHSAAKERFNFVIFTLFNLCCGVLVSSVVLLPTVAEYLSSQRLTESDPIHFMFQWYSWRDEIERISTFFFDAGYKTGLGFTVVSFTAVVYVLYHAFNDKFPSHRGKDIVRKCPDNISIGWWKLVAVLLAITVVSYFFPIWGSIMNGFSYPTDRWIYQINFASSLSMVFALSDNNFTYFKKKGILLWPILSIICLFTVADNYRWAVIRSAFLLFFVATFLLLAKQPKKKSGYLIPLFAITCIVGIGLLNNAPVACGGSGWYRNFKGFDAYKDIVNSRFSKESGDKSTGELTRTDIYDSSYGSSLVTGTAGTTSYYSIQNGNLKRFMDSYLSSSSVQGSADDIQGLEGRQVLETLFQVKKYAENRDSTNIKNNTYYLPLGILFDNYITESMADESSALVRNGYLLDTVVLNNDFLPDEKSKISENNNLKDRSLAVSYDLEERTQQEESLRLNINESIHTESFEYYVIFHGLTYTGDEDWKDLDINGRMLRLRPMGSYSGQTDEFMIKVIPTADFADTGHIVVNSWNDQDCHLQSVEIRKLDLTDYISAYRKKEKHILTDLNISNNNITGIARENQDSILLMSFPYSAGWSCYIDDVRVDTIRADYGLTAVAVPKGSHYIHWSYETPMLRIGACISFVCLVLVIVLYLCFQHRFFTRRK